MGKAICIIGGGGFIGSTLRELYGLAKIPVHIIGRSRSIPVNVNEVYYSIQNTSFEELEKILLGTRFSAVIDLAYTSVPGTSYADPIKDFTENLYNVIKHLELSRKIGADKFIYVSSGGTVYGESTGIPHLEEAQNFPLSPYGVTKLACERYVYMHHRLYGLPTVIVRPSNIYGPGQKPFRGQGLIATALGLAVKAEPLQIFGDGSHIRDYLYINDFCTAITQLISHGVPGQIYNVGSGEGISINSILREMNAVLKTDGLVLNKTYLGERPFDVHYNVLDTSKIYRDCGWEPETEIGDGIKKTWEWTKGFLGNYL